MGENSCGILGLNHDNVVETPQQSSNLNGMDLFPFGLHLLFADPASGNLFACGVNEDGQLSLGNTYNERVIRPVNFNIGTKKIFNTKSANKRN
jgi:alpha-tubulin suppressor-like RCC1 family protein